MKNIGFYYPLMNMDQSTKDVVQVMKQLSKKYNVVLFNTEYNYMDTGFRPFAILPNKQAMYFDGILFAFDPASGFTIRTFPGPIKKYLIISDILWKDKSLPATTWEQYMSEINIITRGEDNRLFDIYNICWNPPAYNMPPVINSEDFEYVIEKL